MAENINQTDVKELAKKLYDEISYYVECVYYSGGDFNLNEEAGYFIDSYLIIKSASNMEKLIGEFNKIASEDDKRVLNYVLEFNPGEENLSRKELIDIYIKIEKKALSDFIWGSPKTGEDNKPNSEPNK